MSAVIIPAGMVEVSHDEFWRRVMSETSNIHPFPERDETIWMFVGTRAAWGWVSEGYASLRGTMPPVCAINPRAAA